MKEALYETIGAWLSPGMIAPGTLKYVQGMELSQDYNNKVPEGRDLSTLPPCHMMVFQGEPFDGDSMYAIAVVKKAFDAYDPTPYGFVWRTPTRRASSFRHWATAAISSDCNKPLRLLRFIRGFLSLAQHKVRYATLR